MQKCENIRNWARGCKKEFGRCQKQVWPGPAQANFIFFLQTETRARLVQMLDPVYMIFCKNSQHQTCREFQDDSNHIKN